MKKLFLPLVISLFFFDSFAGVNDRDITFSLKKLEDIASLLPEKYLVDRDSIVSCPEICKNKSIVILFNDKHQVSHLGISMFSKETKEIINKPVCDFVERLLLELVLANNNNTIISLLDHYGINLQRNGQKIQAGNTNTLGDMLSEIEEPAFFSLSKDDKTHIVSWEYGKNLFAIQFPLNRELITGANKLESDNALYDLLIDNNCDQASGSKSRLTNASDLVSSDGTVFTLKGDTFMIGQISENTYYKKTSAGYSSLFDANYPKESLSNLFMGNVDNNNLKIRVQHSMYDNFTPEYVMSLNDFLCFFKNDFKIYTASYQRDPSVVNATVIFQNKQYNYIHLLIVRTQKDNLFNANGIIPVSFRSNLPVHNINNLLGELARNN